MLGLLQNNEPTKIADLALDIEYRAFETSPDQVGRMGPRP